MSFDVAADAYGRFMGRYSELLAVRYADLLAPHLGTRVLDVGAGPGALTAVLAARLGPAAVSAVEPSAPFVTALRERLPGVDVRHTEGEHLPFEDDSFDLSVAQLVVLFMTDPIAGLREMARVTRPGGVVSACVWDHGGGRGPLSLFWRAVHDLEPHADDESQRPGARAGDLAGLVESAGLDIVEDTELTVALQHADVDEWWQPYTLGVGPAGEYVAGLDAEQRDRLRDHCARLLGPAPFTIDATAWTVLARVR